MTQDEITKMAEEAGLYYNKSSFVWTSPIATNLYPEGIYPAALEDFAKLVAQHEREAVLQTVEALYDSQDPNPMYQEGYNHALDHIEEFVKTRGKSERTL